MTDLPASATPAGADKASIRDRLRPQRRAIAGGQRDIWNRSIQIHLLKRLKELRIRSLAAYLPFDGEVDVLPGLEILHEQGVRLALPVITGDPQSRQMELHEWQPSQRLATNRFGISEPVPGKVLLIEELDAVLLPLVAFDLQGNRLGMGAGYYDRRLQPIASKTRPMRIGLGFELQRVEGVPVDDWDVRLHGVITEQGWFTFPA